jgi:hypothetical protein
MDWWVVLAVFYFGVAVMPIPATKDDRLGQIVLLVLAGLFAGMAF